ncbi:hypothetical protein GCM10009775_06110 [Microbacterium aoyamense]|uniref:Uncharacterized protein n=1 Tax=Microbacterium aoyamense TaxID=344166 RepID=A0ABP5AKE8_9MICO|nr:hypothetical protein [Microbacterium aoyamense]
MLNKKKWITYGVAGAVGLTLVGGAAAATAANMDLRTGSGSVVPGGPVVGSGGDVLDRGGLQLRVTDTSASVISSPSPTAPPVASAASVASVASAPSQPSVVSAPSPVAPAPAPAAPAPAPAPPAPAPVDSPASPASAASVASAWSD